MSKNLMKQEVDLIMQQPERSKEAASRLKHELMGAMLADDPNPAALPEGELPRVVLVSANDAPATLDRAKVLQREMFEAVDGGLEMKFAYYGPDDAEGVRRCRITSRWISDTDDMGNVMGRAECNCGCYVSIRRVLGMAVKENEERPVQAVVIVGDGFHDNQDDLNEAAIHVMQLRKAGTKLFLFQQGSDPNTERKLKWLAGMSGGVYFPDMGGGNDLDEVLQAVTRFAAVGEEAVKAKAGKGATLLLEKLAQEPMPILEEREPVKVRTTQR